MRRTKNCSCILIFAISWRYWLKLLQCFTIIAIALLFVYSLGGCDSPMVNIFSQTIITVFVIDRKPFLPFGTVAWKLPKMFFDVTLVTSIWTCRDFVARQLRIPNRYKDLRPNCQIAPSLRSSCAWQNYKFAFARRIAPRFARKKVAPGWLFSWNTWVIATWRLGLRAPLVAQNN